MMLIRVVSNIILKLQYIGVSRNNKNTYLDRGKLLALYLWVFGSWLSSLLCIIGELAGGGSVAVALGVSDR